MGERRSVDLIVKAMVEPDFEVSPSLLRLGGDGKGVQTVSLRSTKWLPQLEVTNAHGNRHWLSVQEIRQVEENEVSVTVAIAPGAVQTPGDDTAAVVIQTNSTRQPLVWVPVHLAD